MDRISEAQKDEIRAVLRHCQDRADRAEAKLREVREFASRYRQIAQQERSAGLRYEAECRLATAAALDAILDKED